MGTAAIGYRNLAHTATITSAQSSDVENLQDTRTDQYATFADATVGPVNITIKMVWPADQPLSSFSLLNHDFPDDAMWSVALHSADPPTIGNQITTSGGLLVNRAYTAVDGVDNPDDQKQSVYTFTEYNNSTLAARTTDALVAVIFVTLTGPYTHKIGYLWAGESFSLDSSCIGGDKDKTSVAVNQRPQTSYNQGAASIDTVNIKNSSVHFPNATTEDKNTLESALQVAGLSKPAFLHKDIGIESPKDPSSEGGIVRFVKPFQSTIIGASTNTAADRYSISDVTTAPWR
jgi:hypothetical protein